MFLEKKVPISLNIIVFLLQFFQIMFKGPCMVWKYGTKIVEIEVLIRMYEKDTVIRIFFVFLLDYECTKRGDIAAPRTLRWDFCSAVPNVRISPLYGFTKP